MQLRDKVTVGYIDNFFTSVPPLQELKESSIIVVEKEFPNALLDKSLLNSLHTVERHKTCLFPFKCALLSYWSHRLLFLPCPPYAVNFKKNMDAFDRQEQLVRNYAIDRKPMRRWVRMFVNFLDAIMMSAYIIYKENFKTNMAATQNPSNQLEQI
ncbi:hypothetical protein P5673_018587 [Acropora cervicornis]|uniref:PiggyBac transposable element-derived protein domain-containing protein n=1 Tax=Acropora cervicornis TaxID=6130 RepID=A0AAD9QCU0_ACRCE|nr:hypothetical protein P5673_018587 [Acropora cervicornis]